MDMRQYLSAHIETNNTDYGHASTNHVRLLGLEGREIDSRLPGPDILRIFLNKCSAVAEMGDRLATIDMGRKIGGCACPFWEGGAGSPCNTMRPGLRPTFVPIGILIHLAIWPQQTDGWKVLHILH